MGSPFGRSLRSTKCWHGLSNTTINMFLPGITMETSHALLLEQIRDENIQPFIAVFMNPPTQVNNTSYASGVCRLTWAPGTKDGLINRCPGKHRHLAFSELDY